MPLRTCKECGKREMVRVTKRQSLICSDCNAARSYKKRYELRVKNGECTMCGRKLNPKKCPHCSGILENKLTCSTCRGRGKNKGTSNLKEASK